MGAVAEAVGDPRRRQDPGDAGEGEEGEEEEFRGLCLFPALSERRDVAFLQGRRERQRVSCAVAERRGGGIPSGGTPGSPNFRPGREANGGAGAGTGPLPCPAPCPPLRRLALNYREAEADPRDARKHRGAPRGSAPRSHRTEGQRLRGAQ